MPRKYIKTLSTRFHSGKMARKYKHSREAPEEFARKVACGKGCTARFFTEGARDEHRRLFHRQEEFWEETWRIQV